MDKIEKLIVENAIKRLAERDGLTVQQVRTRIQEAMISGLLSQDPEVKKRWEEIPCAGKIPTPEELILYLAQRAGN